MFWVYSSYDINPQAAKSKQPNFHDVMLHLLVWLDAMIPTIVL